MTRFDKSYRIFSFIRIVFTFSGLPYFRTIIKARSNKFTIFFYDIYIAFAQILIFSHFARFFVKLYSEKLTASEYLEVILPIGYISQKYVKEIILFTNRSNIDNYLTEVDEISYISVNKSDGFLKLYYEKIKFMRRIGGSMIQFQTLMPIIIFVFGPFFLPEEYTIASAGYPMKNIKPLRYFYFFSDLFGATYIMTGATSLDLFVVTVLNFHVAQQEYLKKLLRSILTNFKAEENSKKQLDQWFQLHQKSLRQIVDLKKFLEPLVLVTYIYSLINIVSSMFFVLAEGELRVMQKLTGCSTMTFCLFFMGWFCSLADQLNDQLKEIPEQFDLDEVAQNKWLKHIYLLVCAKFYRRTTISAMGFFTLSSTGFSEVISKSFSFFTTFWQLRNSVLH